MHIARELGISQAVVSCAIAALEKDGLLKTEYLSRRNSYVLNALALA